MLPFQLRRKIIIQFRRWHKVSLGEKVSLAFDTLQPLHLYWQGPGKGSSGPWFFSEAT
jgi:hypothetical protein